MKDVDRDTSPAPALNRGEIYFSLRSRIERDHEALIARVQELRSPARLDEIIGVGIITLSSICIRDCTFCVFRADQAGYRRFRLSRSELLAATEKAAKAGIKRLILKAGDDPGFTPHVIAELARDLTDRFGLHLTLALGEHSAEVYALWRKAGAASYWLRHETCDQHIYQRIRPSMFWVDRLHALETLKNNGYDLGGGIMIGLPNQSFEGLVEDILFFAETGSSAAIIEPYLPPPGSPGYEMIKKPENLIVSPDLVNLEKVIAITRLLLPSILIPVTNIHVLTCGALTDPGIFRAGANALLLDFTPVSFSSLEARAPWSGFPARAGDALTEVRDRLAALGLSLTFIAQN